MLDKLLTALAVGGFVASIFACVLYILYIRELRRYRHFMSSPYVRHRIVAHEAGHATAVLAAKGVTTKIRCATIVDTPDYGGQVSFVIDGPSEVVARELVIIRLAGAAGEWVAREEVYAEGCRRDLEEALDIAVDMTLGMGMRIHAPAKPVVDVETLFPSFEGRGKIGEPVKELLNACMCEAVDRIRTHEPLFHKVVGILLDRREVNGRQLNKLLEEYNAAV